MSGKQAAALALSAFTTIDSGLAMIAPDGRMLMTNPAFARLFGETSSDDLLARLQLSAWTEAGAATPPLSVNGRTVQIRVKAVPQGYVLNCEDITAESERTARDTRQARTDRLTELGNRLLLRERLQELLAGPSAIRDDCALLTIDLDRFKAVNDTLGRNIGDALLGLVARRIRATATDEDIVVRVYGDQFAIIQQARPQPDSAIQLAKRLRDLLSRPYMLEGQLIDITANVGIAPLAQAVTDVDQAIKNADLALRCAKQDHSVDYFVFESSLDETVKARRALETDLRRALALREFALVYQPQFDLQSCRVTGLEALLRWNSPTRGPVSPMDFIPLAEETGIISPIGEWVLRTACRDAANWPDDITVAVNISAVQFANRALATIVLSALADSGLDPRRLELEITESVMLDARGTALGVLQRLRATGVSVSLDDFGTGYSSLGYLRSFPFDKIKIDQSFVRGAAEDPGNRAIVRAIASLGQNLGMATVAEGVETAEHMERVAADGCTHVQGYLISRPLPAERVRTFLGLSEAAPGPGLSDHFKVA
ncbi:GGDEF domain-containing protein [Rhodopseudomonas sp. HC1]|uniref:putative bifunctional diguanylate cyclase/phosphodiesterase n=1 Tax=Rhodopseudomonas infernalis TaxID=2897386 RepID=UPI001EE818DC|nr:GGDEF domain-containing protein [Rhodopseudomonas infernalis]MCG6205755.1 GGDEF domain-containing protein [Rhodopseudomonas infernalis]